MRAKSALNRVPGGARVPFDWTVNPYRGCLHACVYCFARPTHEYLGFDAGRDFEREIVVKVNVPEVLRNELARPSWTGEHVALGTNTDPYQWVEKKYGLMRGIWEALRDARNPCSVLTKSPLVLRDADLLAQIAEVTTVSACFSVAMLDEKVWRSSEPHTPHPRARLEAVAELNRLGIPTGILIAPLMPGLNDSPEQVEKLLDAAYEAGAVSIGGQALFLRGATRDIFMDWLRTVRPDLVDHYETLYAKGAYLRGKVKDDIEAPLREGRARRERERRLAASAAPATHERFRRHDENDDARSGGGSIGGTLLAVARHGGPVPRDRLASSGQADGLRQSGHGVARAVSTPSPAMRETQAAKSRAIEGARAARRILDQAAARQAQRSLF